MDITRRNLLKGIVGAIASVPLIGKVVGSETRSNIMPKVESDSSRALEVLSDGSHSFGLPGQIVYFRTDEPVVTGQLVTLRRGRVYPVNKNQDKWIGFALKSAGKHERVKVMVNGEFNRMARYDKI